MASLLQLMQPVEGGLDEEDAQGGICGEKLPHEELISPPHVVPVLERAHDERPRWGSCRRTLERDGGRGPEQLRRDSQEPFAMQCASLPRAWSDRAQRCPRQVRPAVAHQASL